MTRLPHLVRLAPRIFYVAAALYFFWSMALTYSELNVGFSYMENSGPIARLAILRGLFQASLEALHLAGTGFIVHVLLAIWSSGHDAEARGGEE